MSHRIAITGGIGAGKSTVLALIKELGYTVFSCDEIYKEISQETLYIEKIKQEFPTAVQENKIDRETLSQITFSDEQARARLNAISHPMIMRRLAERMDANKNTLVFAEVPLLFEGNFQDYFSNVIVVLREKDSRINAVCERSGLSKQEVLARLSAQYDYDNLQNIDSFKKQGIYVLENNSNVKDLKQNLILLLNTIKSNH